MLDAQGVYIYTEADPISPWTAYMKLGMNSVSAALALLPSQLKGTTAQRDVVWGTPGTNGIANTAGARRILQDLGTTWQDTAKGTREQYFAGLTDGGANPFGALAPGWYPVAGRMPHISLFATGALAASGAVYSLGSTQVAYTELSDAWGWHNPAAGSSYIIPTISGRYLARYAQAYNPSSAGVRTLELHKNAVRVRGAYSVLLAPGSQSEGEGSSFVEVVAGDLLEVRAMQSSGGSLSASFNVSLTYVAPSAA